MLDRLVRERGTYPVFVRCDNGPEMTSNAMRDWCRFSRTGVAFIEPGSPWENRYVESLGGMVRDELRAVELFSCRIEAKVLVENWREDYNRYRPHRMLTPAAFSAGWRECHETAPASTELRSAYGLAPSGAGANPKLQEPTTRQLSQQVAR